MQQPPKKDKSIGRRGILPLLATSLLLPFLGNSKTQNTKQDPEEELKYETLLKPDGSIVKVKVNALKKSKVIKKNIPNSTFLQWIGKKL